MRATEQSRHQAITKSSYWRQRIRHHCLLATAAVSTVALAYAVIPSPDVRHRLSMASAYSALAFLVASLTVHLRGRMWMYFLKGLHPLRLQTTQFGFANYTGLVAAVLFLLLLLISNDVSVRSLGIKRWKALQRFSYFAFVLTIAHGVAYQLIEKRHFPWVLVFGIIAMIGVVMQASAFRHRRSRAK